ncbi:MAG: two-component regulator propeller domain-containing protein, partial [Calditrichaceae bacterium]
MNKGLYSFDAKQNMWKQYQFGEDLNYPQAMNTIADICPDQKDKDYLWLATFYGLLHFNMQTGEYSHWKLSTDDQNSLSDNIIWDIENYALNNDYLLLIATNDRLNVFNIESGKFTSNFYSKNVSLGKKASRTIYKLKDDQFWIGTMDGVMELTISNHDDNKYVLTHLNIIGLKDNRIVSIYQDKSGVIWMGGIIGGLNSYSSKKKKFASWTKNNNDLNHLKLSNYSIRSLAQTEDDILWIGTENKLNKVNFSNNSISYWNPDIKLTGRYTNYYIWSLYPDKNNLWIGTMGLGLFYLNTKSNNYRQWQLTRDGSNSINHNFIPCLLVDSKHQLWIGTWGGGLNHYNPEKDVFKHYINDPEDPSSISHNSIWSLYEDSENQIWIGTYGGGLNRFDRQTETFKRYEYSIDDIHGISNNTIYSIVEDDNNNLWIGTNGGLNIFDRQTETFTNFTTIDGLSNNVIYGIIIDKNKKLWLSSNNGLMYFDPSTREVRNYTVEEGLQNNEFNAGAYLKTNDGKLIFGGINGLNIFQPDSIQQSNYQPPIVFTDFRLYNQSVQPGIKSPLKNPIEYADKIELNYHDKVFSIDFASLDYNNPEKNVFYYKLEGFDEKWIFTGNRNSVTYTNLNPGEYVFSVKGSNHDGVISAQSKKLFISIVPPYWQTLWFNILVILIAASLLYWLYRYRLTRVLEMERMRIRIASDLHDDIGSTLTKIAINSEIIQSTQNKEKIKQSSIKIGRMSREIISSMSDIIWSIDARNDSIKDLLDRMRDFSSTSFAETNIKVNFLNNDFP